MHKALEPEYTTTPRFCDEMNEKQLTEQEQIKQAIQERIQKYMLLGTIGQ